MDDFKEAVVVSVFAVLGCGVLLLILGMPLYFLDRASCHATWEGSGYQTDYGLFSDCRINVKGQWIPADALRSVKEAQE